MSFADSRLSTWLYLRTPWCSHRELNSDPLIKSQLCFRYTIRAWYSRKESNLHHALIWGLQGISLLHYLCATRANWSAHEDLNPDGPR